MELIDKNFKIIFKNIHIHTHVYRGMEITDESMVISPKNGNLFKQIQTDILELTKPLPEIKHLVSGLIAEWTQ